MEEQTVHELIVVLLTPNELTTVFFILLIIGTGIQIWLAGRQMRYVRTHQDAVPDAFADKISLEEHQKAAAYTLAKTHFGRGMIFVEALLLLLWTLGGLLYVLDQLWRSVDWSPLWTGVAVMISFMLISTIIELPASIYRTFYIETRFGFNRTTPSLFIADIFKSLLLSLVIGVPFITLILWLMAYTGDAWWLYAWVAWMTLMLSVTWAYPVFIAPLFNKFEPLQDETLRERIESLLQRNGFASKGIFVIDGSKRSGHGNAYFTGLGSQKRIVFFDTLLSSLNVSEVETVLAHELGHFKHKHIQKRIFWVAILTFLGLALLGWLEKQVWFYEGLGAGVPSHYMALLLFMLVMPVFAFFFQPITAWLSRRHEFEADNFAVQQTQSSDLIQALVKLYKDNASTLTPDPLYSAFYDSHPPAPVRVARLMQLSEKTL
jgi:STE24 endopeptidase